MKKTVPERETLLIALGGNALIQKGQKGTAQEQLENLKIPAQQIAALSRRYKVIVTHGNGPQVGNLLLQQESCTEVPKMPLEVIGAMTQGQIGYMIESTLDTALMDIGVHEEPLLSLITYVVVDEGDPADKDPTKPIGPVYAEEQVAKLPYPTRKTPKEYRRVIASPRPVTTIQKREIKKLIESGFIVICCGGGGIPVIRKGRSFCGVDAVIDKDLASAKLAEEVGADLFIIATDVDGVILNYGKPDQKILGSLTVDEAATYLSEGQFPPGSMGPKVDAAIDFIRKGGRRAVITALKNVEEAVAGKAGTEIVAG